MKTLYYFIKEYFSPKPIPKYSCDLNCADRIPDLEHDCYSCSLFIEWQNEEAERIAQYNATRKWWMRKKAVYIDAQPGEYGG